MTWTFLLFWFIELLHLCQTLKITVTINEMIITFLLSEFYWWRDLLIALIMLFVCSLFNDAFFSYSYYIASNKVGCERKRFWSNFKVLSQHLLTGDEKNHKELKSQLRVSGPRFEPGTSRIRSRNVNNSAATFGTQCCQTSCLNVAEYCFIGNRAFL
jgi:hypothetical protein